MYNDDITCALRYDASNLVFGSMMFDSMLSIKEDGKMHVDFKKIGDVVACPNEFDPAL